MSSVTVILAILASAVVVFGGLWRLTRAVWVAAQDLRDNKSATIKNTEAIGELSQKMDGRITSLENRMLDVEKRIK